MTIDQIISYVADKTLRSDKDSVILRGINQVKNDICNSRLSRLWTTATSALTADQYDYDFSSDFAISDFGLLDSIQIKLSNTWYYPLKPTNNPDDILTDPFSNYPNKYYIYGNNKVLIGASTPKQAFDVLINYYKFIDDYTTGSTQPVLDSEYGSDLYIYGATGFLWDDLEQYDRASVAYNGALNTRGEQTPCYKKILNDIISKENRKQPPMVSPDGLF